MQRCEKCGQWVSYIERHKCQPEWLVWPDHYDEDDAMKVFAHDHGEAAEKWADAWDSDGDYTIIGGSPETVSVKGADGVVRRFEVSGEAVPEYTATEVR